MRRTRALPESVRYTFPSVSLASWPIAAPPVLDARVDLCRGRRSTITREATHAGTRDGRDGLVGRDPTDHARALVHDVVTPIGEREEPTGLHHRRRRCHTPITAVARRARTRQGHDIAAVDHYVKLFKAIGSPSYPTPEDEMREHILQGVQRSFHPEGTLRQMLAIVSDITRAEQLSRITCPTLVLHGKADPLVPYVHGEDTAQRIGGSRLLGMEGMGHDLPSEPVAWILDALIPHLQAAEPLPPYIATAPAPLDPSAYQVLV